jgi:hypothetical protein
LQPVARVDPRGLPDNGSRRGAVRRELLFMCGSLLRRATIFGVAARFGGSGFF